LAGTTHFDPGAFVRRFRQTYVNLYNYWTNVTTSVPDGVELRTPQEHPLHESDIPESLKTLLANYRTSHPKERIELVKYMRTVNGNPSVVIEDGSDLPPETELLTFSQTQTLVTAEFFEVITDVFVARRT
jgi:hypothetical protein